MRSSVSQGSPERVWSFDFSDPSCDGIVCPNDQPYRKHNIPPLDFSSIFGLGLRVVELLVPNGVLLGGFLRFGLVLSDIQELSLQVHVCEVPRLYSYSLLQFGEKL